MTEEQWWKRMVGTNEEQEGLDYITQCCVCTQVRNPFTKEYGPKDQYPVYVALIKSNKVSHTYCEPCLDERLKQVEEAQRKRREE